MKTLLLALCAMAAFGQEAGSETFAKPRRALAPPALPAPPDAILAIVTETRFAGHRMGEPIDDWLAANGFYLPEICAPHDKKDQRMDFKTVCLNLSSFRNGKEGNFYTKDSKGRTVEWSFVNARVASAMMTIFVDYDSSAQEQVKFLTEVYGAPSDTREVPYQNSYGAKWTCIEATWQMPDGAVILGVETIVSGISSPNSRQFLVNVISKEYAQQAAAKNAAKENPYKH
jgi:hypothetical protein